MTIELLWIKKILQWTFFSRKKYGLNIWNV